MRPRWLWGRAQQAALRRGRSAGGGHGPLAQQLTHGRTSQGQAVLVHLGGCKKKPQTGRLIKDRRSSLSLWLGVPEEPPGVGAGRPARPPERAED